MKGWEELYPHSGRKMKAICSPEMLLSIYKATTHSHDSHHHSPSVCCISFNYVCWRTDQLLHGTVFLYIVQLSVNLFIF
jgi:hypothetical protein